MVISTGMTFPRWESVAALYCLQKSMMLTPCGPSAVPTGGAGVACPACSWTLTMAATLFLLGGMLRRSFVFRLCRGPYSRMHGQHRGWNVDRGVGANPASCGDVLSVGSGYPPAPSALF